MHASETFTFFQHIRRLCPEAFEVVSAPTSLLPASLPSASPSASWTEGSFRYSTSAGSTSATEFGNAQTELAGRLSGSSGSNSSSMRAGSRAESLFDVYRDNKDVREQWETTVENMASSKPCNDPTCSDCRWPRSQHPRIECLTARAKCPRIAAKFEEHVQVVYYDHALQHLTTITVVAYCLLAAVLMMYSVGSNGAEFVTTPERDFSTYPTVALLTVLIGVGCDLVLLVFLWGVQAGCWLRLGQEQIAAATAREKRLRRSKSARGGGGGAPRATPATQLCASPIPAPPPPPPSPRPPTALPVLQPVA